VVSALGYGTIDEIDILPVFHAEGRGMQRSRSEPRENLSYGARERQKARKALWVIHDPHE
jgi:hypothetical protein